MASAREMRELSETLAAVLGREQGREQRQNFFVLLDEAEQFGCLERVINHPLQRYNGRTLVHLAAVNGLWEYLEQLLKKGGDPNKASAPPDLCQTPLHLAAHKGYAKCLMILLEHGATIRVENTHRVTPLDLVRGKEKCEAVIHQAIAKVDIPPRTKDQQQLVRDLHQILEEETDMDIFYAHFHKLREEEKDLSARWTDWFQQTLLYRAVHYKREDVVVFLLSQSTNQPLSNLGNGDTPLLAACRKGSIKIASLLLSHSNHLALIRDNQNHLYPLHIAASRGDILLVKLILNALTMIFQGGQAPRDINFKDKLGRTPLFNACYHGRVEVVHQLLAFNKTFPRSVDVNSQVEGTGRTPLHAAVAKESLEIVQLLLQDGQVNIHMEACPSSHTRLMLRKELERKRSQTVLFSPVHEKQMHIPPGIYSSSVPSWDSSFPDRIGSPILQDTSTCSQVSDDIDAEIGVIGSPILSSPSPTSSEQPNGESPSRHFAASLSPLHPHTQPRNMLKYSRSATVDRFAQSPTSQSSISFDVYLNSRGNLEILESEAYGYRRFSEIPISPLAEACVFKKMDIIELLLHFGAIDRQGMACQIAYLLKKESIISMILARDCYPITDGDPDKFPRNSCWLDWSDKHLQKVSGKWMDGSCTFFVHLSVDEDELPRRLVGCQKVNYQMICQVQLNNNYLSTVPIELFCLPNIVKIDLSNNILSEIPENSRARWGCSRLDGLNISNNQLTVLPSSVWYLESLRKLRADSNQLRLLYSKEVEYSDECSLCPALEELQLQHNNLQSLPEFIFTLHNLTKASFGHNKLVSLPERIWFNSSIEEIDLSHNLLSCLPYSEVNELTDLTDSTEVPTASVFSMAVPSVGTQEIVRPNLQRMRSLYTGRKRSLRTAATKDSVKVRHVEAQLAPAESIELEYCDYSSLMKLNISNNQLSFFPTCLPCMAPNLAELDISCNHLRSVDIQFLPQGLKKLMVKNCQIKHFGQTMTQGQSRMIKSRCFHDPQTKVCLHRQHDSLQFLATLHLNSNFLTDLLLLKHTLPEFLLPKGEIGVKESEFCPSTSTSTFDMLYPGLEGLDLTGNHLCGCFNPNIGRQTQLKWIRLCHNPSLERIPKEFAHLKKGNQLTLLEITRGLPRLVQPPPEYQTKETTANQLLTYLKSLLKKSTPFRTMKLFFIGDGERGKTTLLHRLKRESFVEKIDRTEGIDIEEWQCRGSKGLLGGLFQHSHNDPIHFLCWDFAGQGVYQVTHQCFYSCRSLYLALFRLCDGLDGVAELDHWLRNVQLRAPGCVVIVVGTHLDRVTEQESVELEKEISTRYRNKNIYPQVVACVSVSCRSKLRNNIDKLRQLIYDTATHLAVSNKDSRKLDYSPKLSDKDPQLLLQQQIPHSFLTLQESIREVVDRYRHEELAPIMDDSQFVREFKELFDDEEELREAVYYLNLQGTLLHFNDFSLRKWYFLDPQWLAKLMAKIINQKAENEDSPITDGKADINDLFQSDRDVQVRKPQLRDTYLNLLEKFEVVLKINSYEIIIPSLMPDSGHYPKPSDSLNNITMVPYHRDSFQPPLRRIWLSPFIPDGFWPRLICRVIKDKQINSVLTKFAALDKRKSSNLLNWVLWKTGMAFVSEGRTLVIICQNKNHQFDQPNQRVNYKTEKYRLDLHVYVPDMLQMLEKLMLEDDLMTPSAVTAQATRLLVAISNHVLSLDGWFNSMLVSQQGQSFESNLPNVGYIPCWKCYGDIEYADMTSSSPSGALILGDNGKPIYCFGFSDCITPAVQGTSVKCPFHGALNVIHIAPDLMFRDLEVLREDKKTSSSTLQIKSDLLGKGGFGFVCKGELVLEKDGVCIERNQVAVKVFFSDADQLENKGTQELVKLSVKFEHLCHSYKEIRQEVSFLSSLNHDNIAKLCGVKMQPTMCLLLELAPKTSLRNLLKEYRYKSLALEPPTIQACALQIAAGLEYLHSQQVVHLDMKSSNCLVWEFPEPHLPAAQRIERARDVQLKIADYGISQISPTMIIRVESKPIGTPGYMAPELFSGPGQEILATKVDVFAYSMTLYEMISLQVPLYKTPAQKRNAEVRRGLRPTIGTKEKHSPVLVRELMALSWHPNPDIRPDMKQCKKWTSSDEFVRLRANFTLSDVSSVACACVSHIDLNKLMLLQPTEETDSSLKVNHHSEILQPQQVHEEEKELENWEIVDGTISAADSTTKSGGEIQPATPDEIKDVPDPRVGRSNSRKETQKTRITEKDIDLYTQIWMCGKDRKKGLFSTFLFPDNQKSNYSFWGSMGSREDIHSMCLIRDTCWMGTSQGILRILHAPTAKLQHSWQLPCQSTKSSSILKIVHVEEKSCVLVTTLGAEIWVLHDQVVQQTGLAVQQKIELEDFPVYDLVKVNLSGEKGVQVWGTMDNNTIICLEPNEDDWKWNLHYLEPIGHMKYCSHIICCSFTTEQGMEERHVWVSYRGRGYLVCFDVQDQKHRCAINCAEVLQTHREDGRDYNVNTLLAHDKVLFAGTMSGVVAMFDSMTCQLLSHLSWHSGKVRFLLALPDRIRACICAEVPLERKTGGRTTSSPPSPSIATSCDCVPLSRDRPLIASIGNGRRRYTATNELEASYEKSQAHEDITLLVWQS